MYDTIDPSPGDFWGFADWNPAAKSSFPSASGYKSGPDAAGRVQREEAPL